MNNNKPIMPNGYKLNNSIIITYRVADFKNLEIYQLESGKYLYLFINAENIPITKKDKYGIKEFKLNSQCLSYFLLDNNYSTSIKDFYENFMTLSGFDAVAGMKDLKNQLFQDVINPILKRDEYRKFKVNIPNGILLYGPPGCGKTFIVRKLAEELDFTYFEIKHSDVSTPYIHGGVGKIAEVFNLAKMKAPSIIFIDELDGLLPSRTEVQGSQSYKLEEINEFLMHLNDAGKDNILVIGATNQIDLIDKAVLRSGRFDKKIYVMPPDYDARIHLFQMYLKDRPIQNIDFEALAGQTINYSCSDIEFICDEAARQAVSLTKDYITQEEILLVIEKTNSSII